MQFKTFILLGLLVLSFTTCVYSQVVCSEDELVKELREDIDDNGLIYYIILITYKKKISSPPNLFLAQLIKDKLWGQK